MRDAFEQKSAQGQDWLRWLDGRENHADKNAKLFLLTWKPVFDGFWTVQRRWAGVENLARCARFVSGRVDGEGDEESVQKMTVRGFGVGAIRDKGWKCRDCTENGHTRLWRSSSSRTTRVSDGIAWRGRREGDDERWRKRGMRIQKQMKSVGSEGDEIRAEKRGGKEKEKRVIRGEGGDRPQA